MDTKPLERFATWARRELISAVDAQAAAVLASGSVARSESTEAVKKLEAEIGRQGRQHVVDKVAYTWFNRIIALRFMDARGYTDTGVVSPAQGQAHGQPEILSDAKRGNLDTKVLLNTSAADAIIGLLDGTRRSTDAEGEAYALLLTEYCRFWHKSMPFMFEREGDYTELLVPANLLADGSILARAREALTKEMCADVEVIGWLYQFYISERKEEVFAGFKKNKRAGVDEIPAATQLFTPHWIVRYLVENSLGRLWMLNRPTSRLVDRMDYYIAPVEEEHDFLKIANLEELKAIDPACGSGHMLTYAFDLLYGIYEEEGYPPSEIPGLILTNNLFGTEIDPRAGALAAFALTMKARAKQRTFLSKQCRPNVCVLEPIRFTAEEIEILLTPGSDREVEKAFWNQFENADTLGSLIQPDAALTAQLRHRINQLDVSGDLFLAEIPDLAARVIAQAEYLLPRYSAVVANPPFMGQKNMGAELSEFVSKVYPVGKNDLFSAFILRAFTLVKHGGQLGVMCPFVWMFISSYRGLRGKVLENGGPTTLVQLEYSGFEGATVPVCSFTAQRTRASSSGAYVRLSDFVGSKTQGPAALRIITESRKIGEVNMRLSVDHLYRVDATVFRKIPGSPYAYWVPRIILDRLSGTTLDSAFSSGGRLKTHGNERFVRYFWEVSLKSERWRRLANGGAFSPYGGNDNETVDWSSQAVGHYHSHGGLPGEGYVDRTGITWNLITSARTSFRINGEGEFYSSASPTVFPLSESADIFAYLAYLNSDVVASILNALNPTLNTVVNDILRLPEMSTELAKQLAPLGKMGFHDAREIRKSAETSPMFISPFGLRSPQESELSLEAELELVASEENALFRALDEVTKSSNRVVQEYWSLDGWPPESSAHEISTTVAVLGKVIDLVSYAVGCMFGRYSIDQSGPILADQGATLQDFLAQVPIPSFVPDADNVIPFVDDGWFEDDIVERFRQFLRAAFGTEHFEENLRFVEESLGVRTLRDYFITKSGGSKFYTDHVQRYKKRPIYWMFSSPKGSFNALIYMHRYTPSTVSTVLNEYLREYRAKLEVALANAEKAGTDGASVQNQKEADRLRKVLVELAEYEHDVLYPLATQQITIDLDDGVNANYSKFYPALKKITGREAAQ